MSKIIVHPLPPVQKKKEIPFLGFKTSCGRHTTYSHTLQIQIHRLSSYFSQSFDAPMMLPEIVLKSFLLSLLDVT